MGARPTDVVLCDVPQMHLVLLDLNTVVPETNLRITKIVTWSVLRKFFAR